MSEQISLNCSPDSKHEPAEPPMEKSHWTNEGVSLFTSDGERKYLTQHERKLYLHAVPILEDEKEQTFCEMILYTGCRPTEARMSTVVQIDIDECMVTIRSLKKRGKNKGRKFRRVPIPRHFMDKLVQVHNLRTLQAAPDRGVGVRLWTFGRTTAWQRVNTVMDAAGLNGMKACARGLRHAFGVCAAVNCVPQVCIQKWLGHEDIATTSIYIDMAAPEDHILAARMWDGLGA